MAKDLPQIKCKVECKCGWTEVFSSQFSGVIIECPECGKTHLIPTFQGEALDDSIDVSTMNRLLQQQQETAPAAQPRVTVPFRQLFVLACTVSVLLAVVMTILYFVALKDHPVAVVAIIGGGLSWPLGISVAWLGQRRQLRKVVAAETPVD